VNRLREQALWSAVGSFVVRVFQARFDTPTFEVFVIGKGDKVSGPLDLRTLVERVVRAALKRRAPVRGLCFLGRRRRRCQDRRQWCAALSTPDVDPQDGA